MKTCTRSSANCRGSLKGNGKKPSCRNELEFHLAEEAEERKIIGLTEEDARFAARRDLGSLALIREDTSATWGWPLLEQFAQDVRQGSRALVRSPTFALTAIVTFALGIGMTTAIFSVVYGMLLRPLPLHESDRLVVVSTIDGTDVNGAVSPPNFMSLAEKFGAKAAPAGGAHWPSIVSSASA